MKKKFYVVVHFEGSVDYTVEAENEDEAREIAEEMFRDDDKIDFPNAIADSEACDAWEVEDNDE